MTAQLFFDERHRLRLEILQSGKNEPVNEMTLNSRTK